MMKLNRRSLRAILMILVLAVAAAMLPQSTSAINSFTPSYREQPFYVWEKLTEEELTNKEYVETHLQNGRLLMMFNGEENWDYDKEPTRYVSTADREISKNGYTDWYQYKWKHQAMTSEMYTPWNDFSSFSDYNTPVLTYNNAFSKYDVDSTDSDVYAYANFKVRMGSVNAYSSYVLMPASNHNGAGSNFNGDNMGIYELFCLFDKSGDDEKIGFTHNESDAYVKIETSASWRKWAFKVRWGTEGTIAVFNLPNNTETGGQSLTVKSGEVCLLKADTVMNTKDASVESMMYLTSTQKITVEKGATLIIDGHLINDGQIVVKEGGTLIIERDSSLSSLYYREEERPISAPFLTLAGNLYIREGGRLTPSYQRAVLFESTANLTNYGYVVLPRKGSLNGCSILNAGVLAIGYYMSMDTMDAVGYGKYQTINTNLTKYLIKYPVSEISITNKPRIENAGTLLYPDMDSLKTMATIVDVQ